MKTMVITVLVRYDETQVVVEGVVDSIKDAINKDGDGLYSVDEIFKGDED